MVQRLTLARLPVLLLLLGIAASALLPQDRKYLFLDHELFANFSSHGLELVRHRPHPARLGVDSATSLHDSRVIWPTDPWEEDAMGGYSTVLQAPTGEYRFYYECSGPGRGGGSGGHCCVATSADGITWTKPKLDIVRFDTETSEFNVRTGEPTNIVFPTEHDLATGKLIPARWAQGSTWVDTRPMALNRSDPHTWPWKMVAAAHNPKSGATGSYALASLDGYHNWTFLSALPAIAEKTELPNGTACCDTSVTAWWDDSISKYVVFDRIEPAKGPVRESRQRRIGRCETSSLADWCPDHMQQIFTLDERDPPYADVYTNAATPYEGGVYLFFPSIYWHFLPSAPISGTIANDGLWDTRFLVSRDGRRLSYGTKP